MARVFTTFFNYGNKCYTAVISQVNGALSLYVPDESLHHIFPAGRISFRAGRSFEADVPDYPFLRELVRDILAAAEQHDRMHAHEEL